MDKELTFLLLNAIKEKAEEIDSLRFDDIEEERKASNIAQSIITRAEMAIREIKP